jgi:hypothetical protein
MKLPVSKKRKNIERGAMGDKVGRVHMQRQDTSKIHVTSMKKVDRARDKHALKKQKQEEADAAGDVDSGEESN